MRASESKPFVFGGNVVQEVMLGTNIKYEKSQAQAMADELLNVCRILNIDPAHLQARQL